MLVDEPKRAGSGRRQYDRNDVEWLTVCTKLRETGMSVHDLARYARLLRTGDDTEAERLSLLTDHRRKVVVDIA